MAREREQQPEQNIAGMGAVPHDGGVSFRVWAPHAEAVFVSGTFNDWSESEHPMAHEENGYWYAEIAAAQPGDQYRYYIVNGTRRLWRIDPYAREVTHSNGNGIIHDPEFDWCGDCDSGRDAGLWRLPDWNELVIYELHVGTFFERPEDLPGEFEDVVRKFDHLKALGVNVLQVMPCSEFSGDLSWGYNPAQIFSVEVAYGGTHAFKEFVRRAHLAGFAVIVDVVYNHFGPSDLSLWQFDGWSENGLGGIYFYNDWRARTPWGHTRPDFGRPEVRQYIRDNAHFWFEEFHVDGLRFDGTAHIRSVFTEQGEVPLAEGWQLLRRVNAEIRDAYPRSLTIAEDLQGNEAITREDGAGCGAQWSAAFVHTVRHALKQIDDGARSLWELRTALMERYNGDAFQRVVYCESHDEVGNGGAPLPAEIDPEDPESWASQKRTLLGAVLTLTAPGIPMIFQGQEFLSPQPFEDRTPLDWRLAERFRGICLAWSDLIGLRLNRHGTTKGFMGQEVDVYHLNDWDKVLAWHRFMNGGPGDSVVVVMNLSHRKFYHYEIGFPLPGTWQARFSSDWRGYSELFGDMPTPDVEAGGEPRDGMPARGAVNLGPYSAVILSQE